MTEYEIKRLRNKFILTSTLTLFLVMLMMGGCIFLFSTVTISNEAYQIMNYIAKNDGELPVPTSSDSSSESASEYSTAASTEEDSDNTFSEKMEWSLEGIFGVGDFFGDIPDFTYTTRYFAVLFDENDAVTEIKTSHIAHIDEKQAEEYALIALHRVRRFGNFGRYYYYCADREGGGTIVIYLDRTEQITLMNRILFSALSILGLGTLLSYILMRIFSRAFVQTEVDNFEKQKQFITNASHELKTPLTVIKANTEMQELLGGENEWTQSTMRQVDRMNGLIGNLVQIARAREKADGMLTPIDIVPPVSETADSFIPVAASEGKTLQKELPDSLVVKAEDSRIRQLTSLLTDNAVKYCDDGGTILVSLTHSGRGALLSVSNDYAEGAQVDYSRFFERFYRQDEARTISSEPSTESTSKNGYGVGLSIAESLVKSMHGTISVSWKDGRISFNCKI